MYWCIANSEIQTPSNWTDYSIVFFVYRITALAGNDDVKRDLVKSGIVPIVTSLLTRHSVSIRKV